MSRSVPVAETDRLTLRPFTDGDEAFIIELLNDPSWLRFIGDRNVHTVEAARNYLADGPVAMYARLGFGLYAVERKADGLAIGMCGLIKRDSLPDVDIGFAFLPAFRGQGYALEAATTVMTQAERVLGLRRVIAITSPDNLRSISLLAKLGMKREGTTRSASGDDTALFAREFV